MYDIIYSEKLLVVTRAMGQGHFCGLLQQETTRLICRLWLVGGQLL